MSGWEGDYTLPPVSNDLLYRPGDKIKDSVPTDRDILKSIEKSLWDISSVLIDIKSTLDYLYMTYKQN